MRLSALPIPLAVALLSTTSTVALARSAYASPGAVALKSAQLDRLVVRDGIVRLLLRVERQVAAGDATGGAASGGTQTGDGSGSQDTTPAATTSAAPETTTTAAATTEATTTAAPTSSPTTSAQQPISTTPSTTPAAATSATSPSQATTQSTTQTTSAVPTTTPASASQATSSPSVSSTSVPASVSATSASSSSTLVEVTFTSTITNADGSVQTQTGTTQSASAVPIKQNNGGSNAGKVWGIVGGVVGGIVAILASAYLIYRMTQRRFSNLDDSLDEIKWPELQPDGQNVSTATSTLKPLDTHRTGGAGIGDDGDDWDSSEPFMANGNHSQGVLAGGERRYSSGTLLSMSHNAHDASYEQLAMIDQGAYTPPSHYDPFLGPSAAPPQPQNVYPPTYGSPSLNGSLRHGGGSPNLGSAPMGAPGAGGALREGTPPPVHDPFSSSADALRAQTSSPRSFVNGYNQQYHGGPL
ncbi:uncharacterized protein JCM15063_001251 [Sporobolomyces koalae]|uniref:uncharacterized protein n=1 Tax=Sporobolomyces koalae TaxID=500713 RepID=UPI0031817560